MNFPNNFSEHLNQVKLLVGSREIKEFPIAYAKKEGFFEFKNEQEKEIEFIISKGDIENFNFSNREILYDEVLFVHYDKSLDAELLEAVRLFCPLIFVPLTMKKSPFIIAHMAQTLDGKICTNCGNSKWIGNEENLIHAHRLRAIVDGVLVGGKTIAKDLPRLNVRHVKGQNPVRLLLSNSFSDFEKLPKVAGMATFLLRRKGNNVNKSYDSIDKVIYYEGNTDQERMDDLLSQLKENGIDSILLEGGPTTLSSFIIENRIDWFQLHIAPIIFGSGKPCLNLPEIETVSQGRELKNIIYSKVGNAFMVTGQL